MYGRPRLIPQCRVILALMLSLLVIVPVFAGRRTGGDVFVNGYTRKDGTYVQPHYLSVPDGNFYNYWSTKGNVNPYTGQLGTNVTPPAGDTGYSGSGGSRYRGSSSSSYLGSSTSSPTTPGPTDAERDLDLRRRRALRLESYGVKVDYRQHSAVTLLSMLRVCSDAAWSEISGAKPKMAPTTRQVEWGPTKLGRVQILSKSWTMVNPGEVDPLVSGEVVVRNESPNPVCAVQFRVSLFRKGRLVATRYVQGFPARTRIEPNSTASLRIDALASQGVDDVGLLLERATVEVVEK
jgi:hypothetical protein